MIETRRPGRRLLLVDAKDNPAHIRMAERRWRRLYEQFGLDAAKILHGTQDGHDDGPEAA